MPRCTGTDRHGGPCPNAIDPRQDYRKVIGYERQRSHGGTNTVALREPQDEWLCDGCVKRRKRGIARGQTELM